MTPELKSRIQSMSFDQRADKAAEWRAVLWALPVRGPEIIRIQKLESICNDLALGDTALAKRLFTEAMLRNPKPQQVAA